MAPSYSECPNKSVRAANGVDYAYREVGEDAARSCCSSTSAGTSTTGIPRWSTRWRHGGG